tara:strand:- start:389 stop:520 length:132 start_codon:yes stop_codon:yes gene_type:complete
LPEYAIGAAEETARGKIKIKSEGKIFMIKYHKQKEPWFKREKG